LPDELFEVKFTSESTKAQRCRSATEKKRIISVQYCHKSINNPLWKPEIELFWHFAKLEIAYFNEKNPFNFP